MFRLLLGSDNNQAIRLFRHIVGLFSLLIYTLITVFFLYNGLFSVSKEVFEAITIFFWSGYLVMTLLLRTGLNKRFYDPSLTMPQLLWGTTYMLTITYCLDEWRSLSLMAYFGLLSFGYFKLRFREFISVALYAILGYSLIILYMFLFEPGRLSIKMELLQLLTFSGTILVMMYTGSSIHRLRERSKQQYVDLQDALELNTMLATTDELTGLYNRRYFMETITQQKALSERDGSDFVLCFCDLDNFKQINDSFGHHTGDIVLQKFAQILASSIREIDYAARFGGEEFVCLLVNTDLSLAKKVTERIRSSFANYNFSDIAPTLNATVSIGVANFKQFYTIQETLMCADDRMYLAKRLGRNRVVDYDKDPQD